MSDIKSSHELWFVKARDYKGLRETFDALDEVIDKLEAENAALKETQRWIPVSERLPEHGDFVLAWDNEIIEVLKYIRTFGGAWFIDIADAAVYPTHWMPLPEPPIVYGKVCER